MGDVTHSGAELCNNVIPEPGTALLQQPHNWKGSEEPVGSVLTGKATTMTGDKKQPFLK